MKPAILLFLAALLCTADAPAQNRLSRQTYRQVMKQPDSVSIRGGTLTLYNLYKFQVRSLYKNQGKPAEAFRNALLQETYFPFQPFWAGYVGDSNAYMQYVVLRLLRDSLPMLERKALQFSQSKTDTYFESIAVRMQRESGYFPRGKWYLAFGSGVTDLGGFGDGVMVLDMAHPHTTPAYTQFVLPHEMTHQVFDFTNRPDSSARGLYRCINEGFAVYMNQRLASTPLPLETHLQYTKKELEFCLQNEAMIFSRLRPYLLTSDPDHGLALANRNQKIFKDGPGAIGYFVGYRICEAYIGKYGAESWRDIFTLPVRELLDKSGYPGTPTTQAPNT